VKEGSVARRVGAAFGAAVLLLVPAAVLFLMPPWREAALPAPAETGRLLDSAAFVPVARFRSAPTAGQPAGQAGDVRGDFERALGAWENTTPRNPLQYR
jgi:hypothetical protein